MELMLPLKDRKEIAEGTMEFWFELNDPNFAFKAGQHADWTLINPPHIDDEGSTRTFSFVNSPNEKGNVRFATRMRDTAFKNSLKEIPTGTPVKMAGPLGSFNLHEDTSKSAVFLGGGIGITPMRSIIAYASEQKLPHKLVLLYSNRTKASTAFFDDFVGFAGQNSNFTFVPTVTDEQPEGWQYEHGVITQEMIKKYVPDMNAAFYYLSGPAGMVKAMRDILIAAKISGDYIKTEEFSGY